MNTLITKIHSLQDIRWVKEAAKYIFYLAVLMEIVIVIIDKSHLMNPLEGRLFQITFIFCTIKVLLTKYDLREYLIIFLFCLLGLIVDITGDRNELLRAFMFVAACKDIEMEKCLKIVFWTTTFGCAVLAFLSIFGIFGELTVPKEYVGEVFINRYCFGMGNANAFHIMIFALTILGLYVYQKKVKWWGFVALFAFNILVTLMTACKTAAVFTGLSIILFAFLKMNVDDRIKKYVCRMAVIFDVLCVGVAVYFAAAARHLFEVYYDDALKESSLLYKIDMVLTGRIRMLVDTDYWADITNWSLFGNPGHNERYFDLGIDRMFYWYGIIPSTVILVVFFLLLLKLIKEKRYGAVLLISVICGFSVVEAHFVSVYIGRCYPLFILGAFWNENTDGKQISLS